MKLKKLFDFCISQGIEKDPRGSSLVKKLLLEEKKRYEKLSDEEKEDFDKE